MSISCPYCGLPTWNSIQVIRRCRVNEGQKIDFRRFEVEWIVVCRCSNCGKMFYLFKTRGRTFTVKLEDVELIHHEFKKKRE